MNDDDTRSVAQNQPDEQPLQATVPDEQPLPQEQPQPLSPRTPQKRSKKPLVLSLLLMLAIVAAGVMGYLWYMQNQELASLREDKKLTQEALDGANNKNIASAKVQAESDKLPNYGTFIEKYNNILAGSVSGDQITTAKPEIEAALKKYFNVSALPDKLATLSVYQIVKPASQPSGELYALVYYPDTGSKAATFIPMIKQKGGTWQYHEML